MAKLSNALKADQSHEGNQGSLYSVSSNSTKSVDDKLERMNTTQSRELFFLKQQLQIEAMPLEDSTLIMYCTVNHAPILPSLQSSTLILSLTSLVFYSLTAWIGLAFLSSALVSLLPFCLRPCPWLCSLQPSSGILLTRSSIRYSYNFAYFSRIRSI